MREILFRGKFLDNGKWVFGFYTENNQMGYMPIIESDIDDFIVDRKTVGQYTGLKDKDKKRIFEGDIVQVWWDGNTKDNDEPAKYKAVIEFGNPNHECDWGWQLAMLDYFPFNKSILLWVDMEESDAYCEVIGNIHDNPELLDAEVER